MSKTASFTAEDRLLLFNRRTIAFRFALCYIMKQVSLPADKGLMPQSFLF